jgi:hypothetical protein
VDAPRQPAQIVQRVVQLGPDGDELLVESVLLWGIAAAGHPGRTVAVSISSAGVGAQVGADTHERFVSWAATQLLPALRGS